MVERIKTYILGFDDLLDGGIPAGHVVLIAGTPGSMKSSVSYNILFKNAKNASKKGLYISLEQSRPSLLSHMEGLGFKHDEVKDLVSIVDMGFLRKNTQSVKQGQNWMEVFRMYAENLQKTMGYDILVLDSLPVLEIISELKNKRTELFHLFEWLRDLKVTTLLVTEIGKDMSRVLEENYLADGVIQLSKEKVSSTSTQRRIFIDKMRNANHNTDYFTLVFKKGQFQVTQMIAE